MERETLKLKRPVKIGEEMISELHFREPDAGDIYEMPLDPKWGDFLNLGAKMADVPPSTIKKLKIEDAREVMKITGKHFTAGRQIGDSSSAQ